MYSESETLTLPLNPTYVYIRILFSKPRLIIKLTFLVGGVCNPDLSQIPDAYELLS